MPELMHIPTHRYTISDQPLAHTYGVQHDISNILEGKSQANGCIILLRNWYIQNGKLVHSITIANPLKSHNLFPFTSQKRLNRINLLRAHSVISAYSVQHFSSFSITGITYLILLL